MPRVIAIDWDGTNALVVAANVSGGRATAERALSWPEEGPPLASTAVAWGARLKERLAAAGIAPAPLAVTIGRDRLVVKEIRHPIVAAHEEPAIVRFQAQKEFTDTADEVTLDYQPLPIVAGAAERRSVVMAIRKDLLRGWNIAAEAAGLKLIAVSPRVSGLIAVAARSSVPPDATHAHAVLALGAKGGEFVVARGESPLLARSVPAPAAATETALLSELRRNLTVHAGQQPGQAVAAIYLVEPPEAMQGFAIKLQDALGVPVTEFDPLPGIELPPGPPRSAFAGAMGVATLAGGKAPLPINFAQPREPKPPADPNRRSLVLGGALAFLLVVGGGFAGWTLLDAKDTTLRQLRAESDRLALQLRQLDDDARRLKALQDWTGSEVVWLDEIYDLTARFPDTAKLRLVQMTADPVPMPPGKGADANNPLVSKPQKYVSRVFLKGMLDNDDKPLNNLLNELLGDGYHVDPKVVGPNTTGIKGELPRQFTVKMEVAKRTPAQYSRTFTAAIPEKRGGRDRGGFNPFDFLGGLP